MFVGAEDSDLEEVALRSSLGLWEGRGKRRLRNRHSRRQGVPEKGERGVGGEAVEEKGVAGHEPGCLGLKEALRRGGKERPSLL